MKPQTICILPRLEGLGGPASFRARLSAGLQQRGLVVTDKLTPGACDAVLVIAGTRHLEELLRARRHGIRLVQRLDGMNWVHRKRRTGLRHYLRSQYGNWLLATIRRSLADGLVYQSQFARTWWQTVYGSAQAPSQVIYNGVDLAEFTPQGAHDRPTDHVRLLLVEGSLGGGNEQGLVNAQRLADELHRRSPMPVELMVAGSLPASLKAEVERSSGGALITWTGVLPRSDIPRLDRSAHLLFSADLNAACPNAVIEALACGLPVTGFATGSLPELIENDAGRVVPYGSNYWNLEPPEIGSLVDAAQEILREQDRFRLGARAQAEAAFGIDQVVDQYLDVLLG